MALPNLFDLTGQRILVSGAAGGIGAAASRACGALGAELILTDIRPVDEIASQLREAGVKLSTYQTDNTDSHAVAAMVEQVGAVNAIAECSGAYIAGNWQDDEEWNTLLHRLIDINVVGPLNLVRGFLPLMSAAGGGRIAILGSISGRTGGSSPSVEPAYVTTKGALHSLIRYLGRYCAEHKVVVNGLAPGPVLTPLLAGAALNFDMSRFPLGRLADPSEVGWPMAFLCSPGAGYLSGVVIDINGATSFS